VNKCIHDYRPSLRGGYICQLCEKDIDSETYDELKALRTAHDAAVEDAKRLAAENARLREITVEEPKTRAYWSGAYYRMETERDAALATGREQGAQGAADLMWGWGFSATIPREERKALYEAILAAIPSPPKGCEWKQGAEHMRTSCGETVSGHYGQAHCPYCGLPISIKAEEGKP
jgi:rubrerythrin